MKLRNKKTGEIGILTSDNRSKPYKKDYAVFVKVDDFEVGDRTYFYDSFAELCENWEDYEEPKEYWFIDEFGLVQKEIEYYYEENKEAVHDKRIAVGNYFETKEEAEKAVERLRAWKRLKDKGVEFYGWRRNHTGTYDLLVRWGDRIPRSYEVKNDLDLLFGGEE